MSDTIPAAEAESVVGARSRMKLTQIRRGTAARGTPLRRALAAVAMPPLSASFGA